MKYFDDIIREEERARERKYLEDIGVMGRMVDNHLTYPFLLLIACSLGFNIGVLIGMML